MRVPDPLPETMPGAGEARVKADKLTHYLLDPGHRTVAPTASWLSLRLGYGRYHGDALRDVLAICASAGQPPANVSAHNYPDAQRG